MIRYRLFYKGKVYIDDCWGWNSINYSESMLESAIEEYWYIYHRHVEYCYIEDIKTGKLYTKGEWK